ncbi:sugar phosphate nucleotidyltransferase [Aporhodopirellula aestuarii]|uniref:Sugar phosphate nucleotidyltransferase n=1 Tax=Aporhodopirellula aestuarii TaxID=2950107 RepID=A0ABT0UEA7_9BACT|nr:sugar phosphate nucleotidyltransferase [Aporhodopirellula aestuarii]MCM2375151.1 sugar phosphate nucleotidyltransferase [Aporhodopirellula aestuarii]
MKVVLFCGGMGMRMREYSESVPKPMVKIGYRPILWHVMKYYAHYGYKEFILCLGWKGNVIKDYFLNYQESLSNDFVLSNGGGTIDLLSSDIEDWKITFCDTGISSSIGQRLKAVERHLEGEENFLANYTDGLCDVELPVLVDFHLQQQSVATFLSVRPSQSFHTVVTDVDGKVEKISEVRKGDVWMNGGYFVFSNRIFDYLNNGKDIVDDALSDLVEVGGVHSIKYEGFWGCMDTYKEFQQLQDLHDRGETPWTVWQASQIANERPSIQSP